MDKDYILEEIRRTAEANEAVPLGRRKFESETGIKYCDWFGVHWARWSDALRDAGFAPNQFQNAYDEAELLIKYAGLIRELERIPVKGDLRLKTRSDPTFPSDKTFDRIGTKAEVIEKVLQHCRNHQKFDVVVRLCEEYGKQQRRGPIKSERQAPEEIGFVYLTRAGRFYKIGKSNAVGRREREIALQLPEKATTVHVIRTDDPSGIEAYWHKRFEDKRRNGEWFALTAADTSTFKRRKFM